MIRFDSIYLTLALMLVSAAIVVAVGWLGLSALLSMGHYIQSVAP